MKRTLNLLLLLVLFALPAIGTTAPVEDRDMKAALIYDFSVYTVWPEMTASSFNVCAFDDDAENINASLLESKKINGRQINFRIIRDAQEIYGCQVLFIEDVKQSKLATLDKAEHASMLTVVNTVGQAKFSGIINLKLENKKYAFSINNQAAKQANLSLSSKLLRLAETVY
jgi:hypothetical protein